MRKYGRCDANHTVPCPPPDVQGEGRREEVRWLDPEYVDRFLEVLRRELLEGSPVWVEAEAGLTGYAEDGFLKYLPTGGKTYTIKIRGGADGTREAE